MKRNHKAAWIIVSIVLLIFYALSIKNNTGATFFLAINILNITSILFVSIFSENIKTTINHLKNRYSGVNKLTEEPIARPPSFTEKITAFSLIAPAFIFICYAIYISLIDTNRYWLLIKEDGFVEYLSSFLWAVSAFIMLAITIKTTNSKENKVKTVVYALIAAFMFVCAGEEISWGQRIFHLETPELLQKINVQNEITLHNIGSISLFSNAFFILTVSFFWLGPYLFSKNLLISNIFHYHKIPLPHYYASFIYTMSIAAWLVIGIRFGTLGFHPFSFYEENYYTQMDDELFELLAAYSFFSFSIFEMIRASTRRDNKINLR